MIPLNDGDKIKIRMSKEKAKIIELKGEEKKITLS
jgi:hypothetical protein